MLSLIEQHYNKHKEDLRLVRRHGIVEFRVSMKYIESLIPQTSRSEFKILDLGAATGRYTKVLSDMGCDVTAVELVKRNIEILRERSPNVKSFLGNAIDMPYLEDSSFDMVVNFGPLYHLISWEEKVRALSEVKRVTKNGGVSLNAYLLNEYSILSYCFEEERMPSLLKSGAVNEDFRIKSKEGELYDYVCISDIDRLNNEVGLERLKIFSPDGPSDFMRTKINKMSEESFELFIKYQMINAERPDLIGAGSHVVDIVSVHK